MQRKKGSSKPGGPAAGVRARFVCVYPADSDTAQLLHGCPVMAADGSRIGEVHHLMVDALTQQTRYVVLRCGSGSIALTIPWHLLYFDAALAQLVFPLAESA